MSILVDTSAWYALADTADRHHEEAKDLYLERADKGEFLTTVLILAETWTLLTSRLGRSAAITFWRTLRESRTPLLIPEAVDIEVAWHIVEDFADQSFSLVDCTSFALMERLGIQEAFAFDTHFLV